MKRMTVLVQDEVDINRFLQTLIEKLLSVSKHVGDVLSLKYSLVKNGDRLKEKLDRLKNDHRTDPILNLQLSTWLEDAEQNNLYSIAASKDKEMDHAAMVASVQTRNEKDQKGDSNMGNVTADS
jgi:hypothetical protein